MNLKQPSIYLPASLGSLSLHTGFTRKQAGLCVLRLSDWIPAFAGMTFEEAAGLPFEEAVRMPFEEAVRVTFEGVGV